MNPSTAGRLSGLSELVLALILISAVLTFAAPCPPKEDGSFMLCHWAAQVVALMGGLIAVLALLRLILSRSRLAPGLSLAVALTSLCSALVPNLVIPLCMVTDMRCHALTRPFTLVLCALLVLIALLDVYRQSRARAA